MVKVIVPSLAASWAISMRDDPTTLIGADRSMTKFVQTQSLRALLWTRLIITTAR